MTPLPVMVSAATSEFSTASSVDSMAAREGVDVVVVEHGDGLRHRLALVLGRQPAVAGGERQEEVTAVVLPAAARPGDAQRRPLRQATALVSQERRVGHRTTITEPPSATGFGPGISAIRISRPTGTPLIISRGRLHQRVRLHQRTPA